MGINEKMETVNTTKRMTISDIARLAGVAPSTVSEVVNNDPKSRVSRKTFDKVRKVIDKYNYVPSPQARALITKPKLILADEPTGALDSRATDGLLDIFEEVNRQGQTILMVTHSTKAASHAKRILFIKDGQIFHQIYRGDMSRASLFQQIADAQAALMTGGDAQ